MNSTQSRNQENFWNVNKNRILKDYNGGYGVIDWMQFRHFEKEEDVYSAYPVLGDISFGNRPMFIDITEEQWKLKD